MSAVSVAPPMPAEVIPTSQILGAEVRCGDVRSLGDEGVAAIKAALRDHLVIVIRGQQLTDPELIAFGAKLGPLDCAPLAKTGKEKARAHPEIVVVSNVLENGQAIGVLRDAEVVWHSDNSYRDHPLSYSALYSLQVPPSGGNTGFANMYHALETLAPELRAKIDGRTLKHDMTYNSAGDLREGFQPVSDVRDAPGPHHPIVRTHPDSGCDALYLGRRPNAYINGLSVDESEQLLEALWAHATRPEYTWHHVWRAGDILIWDNRCVMHRRDPFDGGYNRIMHRVQCAGEKPMKSAAGKLGHPRSQV